jgi:hypothetical protein
VTTTRRRSFLRIVAAAVATGFLPGCFGSESSDGPPAGSLAFRNMDSVPHQIAVEVLDVGTELGPRKNGHFTVTGTPDEPVFQKDLTSTTVAEPDEEQTYESVFQSAVHFDVRFTIDGEYPGEDRARTVFVPFQQGSENGNILVGQVDDCGGFGWVIEATDNLGTFA